MVTKNIMCIVALVLFLTKLGTLSSVPVIFATNNAHLMDNGLHYQDVAFVNVNTNNPVKTIVIDPGHGGRDPGGSGSFIMEKEVVLNISLILNDLLNRYFPDVNVILTREEDEFVPLHERARIANENNADLFISVHCNVAPGRPHVKGSETFVLGLHRAQENLEVAKRENAVIALEEDYEEHYGGYDPNSPEGHIIFSAYQNAYLGHSIRFASLVEEEFKNTAGRNSRGVKQAGFLVLRQATMPSVLVEAGFLSNPTEEKYLASEEGQREIALSILRGIQQYLRDWGYEPIARTPRAEENIVTDTELKASEAAEVENTESTEKPLEEREITIEEAFFAVQLLSSSSKINTEDLDDLDNSYIYTMEEGGLWRLLSGRFQSYDEAAEHRTNLSEIGYQDAFIIGVKDSSRIPVSELLSAD